MDFAAYHSLVRQTPDLLPANLNDLGGRSASKKQTADSAIRSHGGTRVGAGRKPLVDPKVTLSLRVSSEVKKFLESVGNASETTEQTIRRSTAFREWQKTAADQD
jgi:hypothetical protein